MRRVSSPNSFNLLLLLFRKKKLVPGKYSGGWCHYYHKLKTFLRLSNGRNRSYQPVSCWQPINTLVKKYYVEFLYSILPNKNRATECKKVWLGTRQCPCFSVVPDAMSTRQVEGPWRVPCKLIKALQGSGTDMRELLGGTEEKSVSLKSLICPHGKVINDFFYKKENRKKLI